MYIIQILYRENVTQQVTKVKHNIITLSKMINKHNVYGEKKNKDTSKRI